MWISISASKWKFTRRKLTTTRWLLKRLGCLRRVMNYGRFYTANGSHQTSHPWKYYMYIVGFFIIIMSRSPTGKSPQFIISKRYANSSRLKRHKYGETMRDVIASTINFYKFLMYGRKSGDFLWSLLETCIIFFFWIASIFFLYSIYYTYSVLEIDIFLFMCNVRFNWLLHHSWFYALNLSKFSFTNYDTIRSLYI